MSGHSPRSLTVAVVGATGVVGRTMAQVLLERGFPVGEIRLLASARSTGTTVPSAAARSRSWRPRRRPSTGGHRPLLGRSRDLARAGPPGGGPRLHRDRQLQRLADGAGIPLVVSQDNPTTSRRTRGSSQPELQHDAARPAAHGPPRAVGLERVVVDTYQAVSGRAARRSPSSRRRSGRTSPPPQGVAGLSHPIAFNALPEIDVFLENGTRRRSGRSSPSRARILHHPDLRVSCTAVRVPVFMSTAGGPRRDPHADHAAQARLLFAGVPGVEVRDDPPAHVYPLATEAAGSDGIYVGGYGPTRPSPTGAGWPSGSSPTTSARGRRRTPSRSPSSSWPATGSGRRRVAPRMASPA